MVKGKKGNKGIPVNMGERGTYHNDNKLNELTSKEWIKFTRTWFVHYPAARKDDEILHPAKFPESLAKEFILFFSKKGQYVFDPFLGTGSTLVACHETERNGIGIELLDKYAHISRARVKKLNSSNKLKVITGNSLNIDTIWKKNSLPKIDFVITSPPYGPMLNKKVGIVYNARKEAYLDTNYSDNNDDLANASSYDEFVANVVKVFEKMKNILNKNAYIVVILQNYVDKSEFRPLAWDIGKGISKIYKFKGEKIWCQDNKTLYPYGYRFSFIPNVHHHYCLIFKNDKGEE